MTDTHSYYKEYVQALSPESPPWVHDQLADEIARRQETIILLSKKLDAIKSLEPCYYNDMWGEEQEVIKRNDVLKVLDNSSTV